MLHSVSLFCRNCQYKFVTYEESFFSFANIGTLFFFCKPFFEFVYFFSPIPYLHSVEGL